MKFFKDLEKQLEPEIEKILDHKFLKRISSGELSLNQLQYFGLQYWHYCRAFPKFLAAAASNIEDDITRMPLIENLWEEHGSGKIRKSHRNLYYKFLLGLDLMPEEIEVSIPLKSTTTCIEVMLKVCKSDNFLTALGALGPGTEFFTNQEYSIIYDGLMKSPDVTSREAIFWKEHISLDEEHYSEMISVLFPWARDISSQESITKGALLAIEAEILFWDGIEAELPQN